MALQFTKVISVMCIILFGQLWWVLRKNGYGDAISGVTWYKKFVVLKKKKKALISNSTVFPLQCTSCINIYSIVYSKDLVAKNKHHLILTLWDKHLWSLRFCLISDLLWSLWFCQFVSFTLNIRITPKISYYNCM